MADTYLGTVVFTGNWDSSRLYAPIFNQSQLVALDQTVGGVAYIISTGSARGTPPSQDPTKWKLYTGDYVKTQTANPSTTFDYTMTNVNVSGAVTVDVAQMVLNRIYSIKAFANNTTIAISNGSWDIAPSDNVISLLYAGFTTQIQKINSNTIRII